MRLKHIFCTGTAITLLGLSSTAVLPIAMAQPTDAIVITETKSAPEMVQMILSAMQEDHVIHNNILLNTSEKGIINQWGTPDSNDDEGLKYNRFGHEFTFTLIDDELRIASVKNFDQKITQEDIRAVFDPLVADPKEDKDEDRDGNRASMIYMIKINNQERYVCMLFTRESAQSPFYLDSYYYGNAPVF